MNRGTGGDGENEMEHGIKKEERETESLRERERERGQDSRIFLIQLNIFYQISSHISCYNLQIQISLNG